MGKGCSITYKKDGRIDNIFADNGEKSILFNDARNLMSEDEAAKVWGVNYTPSFQKALGGNEKLLDKNGEAKLGIVMNYVHQNNNPFPLTEQEALEVKTSLSNTKFKSSFELSAALKKAFTPAPTRASLEKTGIYGKTEINNILESPEKIQQITDLAFKIDNSDEILNDIYSNDAFKSTSTTQTDSIGKFKADNPFVNEANAIQQLGGIQNRLEFEQAVQEIPYLRHDDTPLEHGSVDLNAQDFTVKTESLVPDKVQKLKDILKSDDITKVYPQMQEMEVVFYDLTKPSAMENLPVEARGADGFLDTNVRGRERAYINLRNGEVGRMAQDISYTLAQEFTKTIQPQNPKDLFPFFSSFNNVPVKEVVDGKLVDKPVNNTKALLESTMKQPENHLLESALDSVEGIDKDVWDSSQKEVKILLDHIQSESAKIGLDLKGISDKTYDEVLPLTRALTNLVTDPSGANLAHFANIYDRTFSTDVSPARAIVQAEEKFRDKALVQAKIKSPYKAFSEHGLLMAGENLWIQTDGLKKSLTQVYESVYDNVKADPTIFPQGTFHASMDDKSLIMEDLKTFVQEQMAKVDTTGAAYDRDTLEKMILYSQFFGTQLSNAQKELDPEKEAVTGETEIPNAAYLKTEFLADLRAAQLTNDDEVYKNIRITPEGADIIHDDPISMQAMTVFLNSQQGQDLKNYFLLKKDGPQIQTQTADPTLQSQRDMARNFPDSVQSYTGDYKTISAHTVEVKGEGDFVRIGSRIFENVQDDLYGELSPNDSDFREFGAERPEVTQDTQPQTPAAANEVKIRNLYSAKEKEAITDDLDRC